MVDEQGQAVVNADVGTFWSANGVKREELRKLIKEGDLKKLWGKEGQMQPWGRKPTKTDVHGRFALRLGGSHYKLMVIDKDRKHGGVVLFDPRDQERRVTVLMRSLVRVFGKVRLQHSKKPLDWTHVRVEVLDHPTFPIGNNNLVSCGSLESRFEFHVPPGTYVVSANTDPLEAETVPRQLVVVTDEKPEFDLGVLRLVPRPSRNTRIARAKQRGTWNDLSKRYGKPALAWYVTDARGVKKDVTVATFKGKWVLLYFWGPW